MADLESLCDYLNGITESPMKPYDRDRKTGKNVAQIGNYHISSAYGGVCLHRMFNTGGGITTPLMSGHVPKRELYDAMRHFISGINAQKRGVA